MAYAAGSSSAGKASCDLSTAVWVGLIAVAGVANVFV